MASCALARLIAASSASAVAATWDFVALTMAFAWLTVLCEPATVVLLRQSVESGLLRVQISLGLGKRGLGRGGIDRGKHLTSLDPVADMHAYRPQLAAGREAQVLGA